MGWVKLDDKFPEHPKLERIGDRAFRIHIRGLCYSALHLTDGLVPRAVVRRWGSLKNIGELLAEYADRKCGVVSVSQRPDPDPSAPALVKAA